MLPGHHLAYVVESVPSVRHPTSEARLAALLRDAHGDPQVTAALREVREAATLH